MLNTIRNWKTMNIEQKSSMFCFLPLQSQKYDVFYIFKISTLKPSTPCRRLLITMGLFLQTPLLRKKNSTFIKPSQKCKGIKGNMYAQIDCEFHFEASMFFCGGFFVLFFFFCSFFKYLTFYIVLPFVIATLL